MPLDLKTVKFCFNVIIFQGVHGGQGKTGKLDRTIMLGVHRGHPECVKCKNQQQCGKTNLDKKIKMISAQQIQTLIGLKL